MELFVPYIYIIGYNQENVNSQKNILYSIDKQVVKLYIQDMEKIRNKEIYEKFKAGISAEDIAKEEGITRARVYQIINAMKARERVSALPLIDDSKTVQELKERIQKLEGKVSSLESDNKKLLDIIFNLSQKK